MFGNNSTGLSDRDIAMLAYYAYLKINKGLTFDQFCNEDIEVVGALLEIKKLEIERQQNEAEKAGAKIVR